MRVRTFFSGLVGVSVLAGCIAVPVSVEAARGNDRGRGSEQSRRYDNDRKLDKSQKYDRNTHNRGRTDNNWNRGRTDNTWNNGRWNNDRRDNDRRPQQNWDFNRNYNTRDYRTDYRDYRTDNRNYRQDSWLEREIDHRQDTKNSWRNIAMAAGALSILGLLQNDKYLTFGGAAGALYSYNRYQQDKKSQDRLERARASYFDREWFERDGKRYNRRTVVKDGQRYYQFYRT